MPAQAQTRERPRIREALVGLCCERSYAETTLPSLLERAAIDEAGFNRHYVDLEDCFCGVYLELREEFVPRMAAAFAARTGWRNQIRACAYELLALVREDECRARISFVDVLYAGDRAKLIRDEGMQGLFLLIDRGRAEMDDPGSLSAFTAETLGSAIYQRVQTALIGDELDIFEAGLQEMMYMVVLPYLGPEAANEELSIPPPDG